MTKSISLICLGIALLTGCTEQARPTPAAEASPADAALEAALLPVPEGMTVAYGPEAGAFGSLRATRLGVAAMRQAEVSKPACSGAGRLDLRSPEVGGAPAAVVAFSAESSSITEALLRLPPAAFPAPLPAECAAYKAEVGGTQVTYLTRELRLPALGDQMRAYLTTTSGGGQDTRIGSVTVRRGNVVMSLVAVGAKVNTEEMRDLSGQAFEKLTKAMKYE
jgi:hypothetical protein